MFDLQMSPSSAMIFYLFVGLLALTSGVSAQFDPICSTTGPTCYNATDCTTLSNGDYQWCGGCSYKLNCNTGAGTVVEYTDSQYPVWDDNKKGFQTTSTSCQECYTECPPWYMVPPVGGQCTSTGPTCVSGINFCTGFVQMKLLQYCGNCSAYVQCGGLFNPTVYQSCLSGSVWDDTAKSCVSTSTTCRECFEHCDDQNFPTTIVTTLAPTTEEPTTTQPTTAQPTTTQPITTRTTQSPNESSDAGVSNTSTATVPTTTTTTSSAPSLVLMRNVICIISASLLTVIIYVC